MAFTTGSPAAALTPRPEAALHLDRARLESHLGAALARRGLRLQGLRRAVTRVREGLIETTCNLDAIGADGTIAPLLAGLRHDVSAGEKGIRLLISPEDPRLTGDDPLRSGFAVELARFLDRDPAGLDGMAASVAGHRFGSRIVWKVKLRFGKPDGDACVMVRIRRRPPATGVTLAVEGARSAGPVPVIPLPDRPWPADRPGFRSVRPWIEGTPLHDILGSAAAGAFDFRVPGRALAIFHERARLSRTLDSVSWRSVHDEAVVLLRRRDDARCLLEGTGSLFDAPVDRLVSEAQAPEIATPPMRVLHGDLHDKQILDTGRGIGFIDLDLAVLGEPELDAGNLVAHFHLRAIQNNRPRPEAADRAAAFLCGYREAQPLAESRLRLYTRMSLVRLALLYALRLDSAHIPPLLLEEAGRLRRSELS